VACDVAIATDVDEAQANRTVVALSAAGIVAEKAPLPGSADHFSLTVSRADAPVALRQIVEQRLLEREPEGVLASGSDDVLVKSRDQERAELGTRLAGEIERTLLGLDEIVMARVHLGLAATASSPPARASVLLRSKGASPISVSEVKTLVLGAVPSLSADNIDVVLVPAPMPATTHAPVLTRVGPITLTEQSAAVFRAFAFGLIGSNLLLLAVTGALWWRWRKHGGETP
jgi:type III secretory pathway lipoprotein EscJ